MVLLLLLPACGGRTDHATPGAEVARVTAPVSWEGGNIDVGRSVIYWRGTKFRNTRHHEGFLRLKAGNLRVRDGVIEAGSFLADMATIRVTDIPEQEAEARANLERHLRQEFHADQFPYSQFTVTSVVKAGNTQQLCGNLQIGDVRREVCFEAKTQGMLYMASLRLNRSDWKIGAEGSWLEKRLVDDAFYLTLELWVTELH